MHEKIPSVDYLRFSDVSTKMAVAIFRAISLGPSYKYLINILKWVFRGSWEGRRAEISNG